MASEQQKSHTRAEQRRDVRRALAVGLAFGRAKCLLGLLMDEIGNAKAEGVPSPTNEDWLYLRVNRATRASSLIVVYYASLNAVVDGWRKNHLADSRIDEMLSSSHTRTLMDYRNAMFHPTGAAEARILKMGETHSDLMTWALELMKQFNRFFESWMVSPTPDAISRK